MEMNTRLQVEHPVTESITGVDLVEWQLRVASGERLPKTQRELTIHGHAMEARLYAENPATGFLPSTGPLTHFRLPSDIRVDTGVEQGAVVTPFYDPLIAKLIVHAPSRRAAAAKLASACAEVEVWPVKTNAGFLARAASHPEFVAGQLDTGFIEKYIEQLVPAAETAAPVFVAAAQARLAAYREPATAWGAASGFRLNAQPKLQVEVQTGAERRVISLDQADRADLRSARVGAETIVFDRGTAFAFIEPQSLASSSGAAADGVIRAPMPGRVIAVQIADGATVVRGQALVTMEAMKMEHTLTAPFDGVAADLAHKVGDQVSEGAALLRITRDK
jgi:3-methylcrotonyl-CoA carboxylase alpha subunit